MLINTTVQEKNITYPTGAKLAIKIINRLNKLAKNLLKRDNRYQRDKRWLPVSGILESGWSWRLFFFVFAESGVVFNKMRKVFGNFGL